MTGATNSLSNDKHEMYRLLGDQFTSVFTIPDPQQIITDPVSFFSYEPNNNNNNICLKSNIQTSSVDCAPIN